MSDFNKRLDELCEQVARKKRIEKMIESLEGQCGPLERRANELYNLKCREQADVDKLEGRTLSAFFYEFIGKKDGKIEKERLEAYEAQIKYDAAARELEAAREDLEKYRRELTSLKHAEAQYKRLLDEKKAAIKASGTPKAYELIEADEEYSRLCATIRELDEAIGEGTRARNIAEHVGKLLSKAEDYGMWDVMGGGILADAMKHSDLDDAQGAVEELSVQLRRFKTELADVNIEADFHVDIDGFNRFADYFFDNIFTDLDILDRRRTSKIKADSIRGAIIRALNGLEDMRLNAQHRADKLKVRINEILEHTQI